MASTRDDEELKLIFAKYDLNGNGSIQLNELVEMLKRDEEVPRRIVKKLFKYSDTDGDNHIDFNEFVKMVHDEKFKDLFGHYLNKYVNFLVPPQKRRYKPVGRSAVGVEAGTSTVDGKYDESYTFWPPPLGMIIITIIEIVCFIIDEKTEGSSEKVGTGLSATIFIYNPQKRYEAWRFLTYMFVHIGYTHLIVNLLVQLLLGIVLELVHKWWRVLTVYFLGVIAGSLLTSVADPFCFLAGASGGVYALITAHIASIIMNWKDMTYAASHLSVIVIVIVVDVGNALYNRYTVGLDETVGYVAHFGGALAGLLVGIWVLKNVEVTTKEKYLWWAALVIYVILMVILIAINIFWTSHFPKRM